MNPWRAAFLGLALAWVRSLGDGLQPEIPGIEVLESRSSSLPTFSLHNPQLAEMTVSLDFTLDNLTPSVPVPFQVVLAPSHTTPPLVSLHPTNPAKPWHFSYRSFFSWGAPFVRHATNQLYRLPFAPGRAFRVAQGNSGAFSHSGEDRFAVDFGMPEGTPVFAARDGLVVLVRDGFDIGAPDPAYKKRSNLIFIRHADGTLGEYLHLLKGGIKVKPGQTVHAGQMLALSGNSGYTRGPHLHFMVFRARDSKSRESLPIRFLGPAGAGIELEQGKVYTNSPVAETAAKSPDWLK